VKKYFILFVMTFFVCSFAFANEANVIRLADNAKDGVAVVSEKLSGKNLTMKMNCGLSKLNFYDADSPMGPFSVLYAPDFYFGGAYGAPQLPVISKVIQIPFGAEVKVVVKSYDTNVYNLADFGVRNKIYPRQPSAPKDGTKVPFVYEKSAYIHKGFNGQPLATIEEIGVMRHMRLAQLVISPVTYDASENKINVFNNIDFEIVMTGSDMTRTKSTHSQYASKAFGFMDSMVITPKALKFGKSRAKESFVIVADPMFKKALAPYEAWKKSQGYIVKTIYTDDYGVGAAITEPLKRDLHELYNNPTEAMPAPSYVLFVGDHEQIPAFRGKTGSHITELYYVAVTPGDFLPDMLTGRFSAQNIEQLLPQIEKTIEYGQRKFADSSFLDRAVLVAGYDSYWARSHGWAHINYAENYYFTRDNGFKDVYKSLSATSQQNAGEIKQKISEGVAYVNYTAHGMNTYWADPRLNGTEIANLGNKGKYPLVIGNCCLTSKFEVSECFAESWLRAKDAGAIGYVGGTNSTYWDEDFYWGVGLHSIVKPNTNGEFPLKEKTGPGAFDVMFDEKGISNAAFMVAGNLAVEASTSTRKQYYWEVYHLMGDPSLRTYIGGNR
jgi:hypothetical protein